MSGIEVKGAQTLFTLGPVRITETILSMVIVTLILIVGGVLAGRNLTKRPGKMQVLTEKGVSMLRNLVVGTMGAHNEHWTAYIGTIFLSSMLGSLISLTGFLRSTTADLSVVLTWAVMTSAIIWYQSIKRNGFLGWLKGFTEPIWVMTPMNIVSEIAQPVAMAFRHFGNVAGGGVITTLIYTSLSMASAAVLNLITASGWTVSVVLLALAVGLLFWWNKSRKAVGLVFGIISGLLGLCGLLQATGILSGVPILTWGIPAALSCYFDIFSGFVQAYVFTLLTMVYIASSLPEPEAAPAA